jgi:DDE_Tnp_1-associated
MFAYVAVVHDPRRQHPPTRHSLEAMLTLTILATICGAPHWVAIDQWGQAHDQWLSECLALTHGMPSHETCGRVLA